MYDFRVYRACMGQTQLVYFLVNGGCLCGYIGKVEKKETLVVEPWQVQH
jgi:hypothetical protein